MSAKQDLTS